MVEPEPKVHSFIIKLWLEAAARTGQMSWNGNITHVPSGERKSITELDEIDRFIAVRLEQEGVQFTRWPRLARWLQRLNARFSAHKRSE